MRARRVDINQTALRRLWLSVGGSWLSIAPEHGGEPDALVGWRGRDQLVEIKRPDNGPARKRPRPNQAEWHRAWRGRPVAVVTCFDDLRALFEP